MESLEVNAGSVDEAVEIALRDLDAKLSEVEIVILSEGRAGILGIGAEDAKIRVTKLDVGRSRMSTEHFPPRPPAISYAPQSTDDEDDEDDVDDEEEQQEEAKPLPTRTPPQRAPQAQRGSRGQRGRGPAERAERSHQAPAPAPAEAITVTGELAPAARLGREVLEKLLQELGVDAEVVDTQPPGPVPATATPVVAFDVRGDDLGMLIGRRGQTLSSLQYIVNLIASRKLHNQVNMMVDVEGYRSRRYQSLLGLAQGMAERVRDTRRSVTLEPMSAAERRIIHMALQDYDDITTQSVGEGDNRKVSIMVKKQH